MPEMVFAYFLLEYSNEIEDKMSKLKIERQALREELT